MQQRSPDIFNVFFQVKSLDGLWNFVYGVSSEGDVLKGFSEGWFTDDLSRVSYWDLT